MRWRGAVLLPCRKKRRLVISRRSCHHWPWAPRRRHVRVPVLHVCDHRLRHHRIRNRADGHACQGAAHDRLERAGKHRSNSTWGERTLVHRTRNPNKTVKKRIALSAPRHLLRLRIHGQPLHPRVFFSSVKSSSNNSITQLITSHPFDVTHLEPQLQRLRSQLLHGNAALLRWLEQLEVHGVVLVDGPVVQVDRWISLFIDVQHGADITGFLTDHAIARSENGLFDRVRLHVAESEIHRKILIDRPRIHLNRGVPVLIDVQHRPRFPGGHALYPIARGEYGLYLASLQRRLSGNRVKRLDVAGPRGRGGRLQDLLHKLSHLPAVDRSTVVLIDGGENPP
mmetsp:Transcript_34538/g.90089  ORF Transcript_34538/g.90089 Transcript_34538/m.90089 type:complete len:339 (-) Transcript_34538:1858-2874(-)